jgi:hypothetical protein
VHAVVVHPFNNNLLFVGTAQKKIRVLDVRAPHGTVRIFTLFFFLLQNADPIFS